MLTVCYGVAAQHAAQHAAAQHVAAALLLQPYSTQWVTSLTHASRHHDQQSYQDLPLSSTTSNAKDPL